MPELEAEDRLSYACEKVGIQSRIQDIWLGTKTFCKRTCKRGSQDEKSVVCSQCILFSLEYNLMETKMHFSLVTSVEVITFTR